MVHERKPDQLDASLEQTRTSPLQELHRFALGLRKEYGAMRAALCEPWSTGQVEGQLTRLSISNARCMGEPASICCACVCYMRPDQLI